MNRARSVPLERQTALYVQTGCASERGRQGTVGDRKNRYAAVRRVTGIGRLLSVIMAVENYSSCRSVEGIMPSSITQLVIGTVVAIGMAVAGVSAIGSAVAFERNASDILINRLEYPLLEEGTRSVDRERLRTYFFDERGRLR
jgi:hypothetical protein